MFVKQRSSLADMILVPLKTLEVSVGKALVPIPFTAKAVLIRCIKKCSGIAGVLRPSPDFQCSRSLGTARPI